MTSTAPSGWRPLEREYRAEEHFGRTVRCLRGRPRSLPDMVRRAASSNPHGEALVCGAYRATWTELADHVERFAQGLAQRGVGPGDRVILFLGNRAEFVIALLGITRLGAVAVPVGTREQAPGLAYIAQQSEACAVLYEAALVERIPDLPISLAVGEDDPATFLQAFALASATPLPPLPNEDDAALIMFTSGTTGRPKGAIVTQLALVHAGAAYAHCMKLSAADRSACVVPLSHITGITATLCAMAYAAGCSIIVPEFQAASFATLAAAERMTHTLLVPAMYNLLLARVDLSACDLGAWRIGAFGGGPMPVPTIERLARQLGGLQLMNCYGATETCGGVTIMPAEELLANSDSVGWPVPGTDIRVVGEDGRDLPAGATGELWIAGPNVTPGYWRDPEATAANLIDGHWRSGDLGTVDARGFVRVLDRLKDMINRGGYKIFTAEVESILMAHPAVLEAAVIAKPCPVLGERVHAFVVLREEGEPADAAALSRYCATRMTDYKQPESYTISHEPLPRNLNGKVLKQALRRQLGLDPAATA